MKTIVAILPELIALSIIGYYALKEWRRRRKLDRELKEYFGFSRKQGLVGLARLRVKQDAINRKRQLEEHRRIKAEILNREVE